MPHLPFEVAIATPCQEEWSRMSGSARQRYCAACGREVHDFAAMTPREIERIVVSSGGHLCARITRREDGSLVTLPEPQRRHYAAFVLAATLAAAPAFAQSTEQPKALVTGTVLAPDGSKPTGRFMINLKNGEQRYSTFSDGAGSWTLQIPPGSYDLEVTGTTVAGYLAVKDVALHEGLQSFGDLRTAQPVVFGVVSGGISAIRGRRLLVYRLRHPIAYLSYLRRRYL
jgi:hypothetical protein